uniref:Uncharacterized protein n=1 Tax=Lepeophtheirus salmonis TaxID=72036 RepID=A0A0K2UZC8_LEPSM
MKMEVQEFGKYLPDEKQMAWMRNRWLVGFVEINVPFVPCLELNATDYPHLISRAWIFI